MHSSHENSNDNGCRLIDLAVSNNMVISSTCFPHKNIHKATWVSPDGITANQIDHILIDGRHCSNILDVRSCRGPNIDSDHYLVKIMFRTRIRSKINRNEVTKKFDVDRLKDVNICRQYVEKLEERITVDMGVQQVSVNDTWNQVKQVVGSVAAETIGWKTGGIRNDWYDEECQLATQAKNNARLKTLKSGAKQTTKFEYRTKRNIERKLFRDALCMTLHELIVKIWEREEMPEEWELGIICPVYKKGDKLDCSNYRGINLLNTAYKIFANILY